MKALLIRPRKANDPTEDSYEWAGSQKRYMEERGWIVIDRSGVSATRRQLFDGDPRFDCALFYGHGSIDGESLMGQDEKPIIDSKNGQRLSGMRVYAWACCAGKVLGPLLVYEKGAAQFIGYSRLIRRVVGFAKYFRSSANAGAMAVVANLSPVEAEIHVRKVYADAIRRAVAAWEGEESWDSRMRLELVIDWLVLNLQALTVLPSVGSGC